MPVALGVNGGVLGSNNLPTATTFRGVFTPNEVARAIALGFWPVNKSQAVTGVAGAGALGTLTVGVAADPYFEYTTLLLPGNGTNGATNNTFLDGSTNNFTITRNGNTTQGTFSPFSQTGWGNYFDGTGDYLTAPSNAAFAFGTGNFTVEAWVYPTSTTSYRAIFTNRGTPANSVFFGLDTGSLYPVLFTSSAVLTSSIAVSLNAWSHVALVRNGGTTTIYVNGVSGGSVSNSTDYTQTNCFIGSESASQYFWFGYLSNLRIVKGTAVYTGNFTVPTSPLTATQSAGTNIAAITTGQTSLLTCQSNRFVDNGQGNTGNTGFTITVNGNTSVQAFSPFNPTASWSAATYGGSGYFDGSGDYLAAGSNAAWAMSTGDFSIEFWAYPTVLGVDGGYVSADYTTGFHVAQASGTLYFWVANSQINATSALSVNQWQHVVCTRASGTSRIFVNGILRQTGANTNSVAQNSLYIGTSSHALTEEITGYLANVRVVKGQIPTTYTTSSTTIGAQIFTPPTSPLTTSSQGVTASNTSLLLNFTNAGIYDATSKNDLETVGAAAISTAQNKWGGSSIIFNGSTAYLLQPDRLNYDFGTGDFTIEAWIYLASTPSTTNMILDTRASDSLSNYSWSVSSISKLDFVYGTTRVTSSGSISTSSWVYVAVRRSSGTLGLYINGSLDGTASYSSAINTAAVPSIGAGRSGGTSAISGYYFNGYIQDLRVTKGYARTVTTSPTAAFPTL